MPPILGLGLNNANRAAIDEEEVIGRSCVGRVFPDGDAESGAEVEGPFVLNVPAGLGQTGIDLVAGELLRVLISCAQYPLAAF